MFFLSYLNTSQGSPALSPALAMRIDCQGPLSHLRALGCRALASGLLLLGVPVFFFLCPFPWPVPLPACPCPSFFLKPSASLPLQSKLIFSFLISHDILFIPLLSCLSHCLTVNLICLSVSYGQDQNSGWLLSKTGVGQYWCILSLFLFFFTN